MVASPDLSRQVLSTPFRGLQVSVQQAFLAGVWEPKKGTEPRKTDLGVTGMQVVSPDKIPQAMTQRGRSKGETSPQAAAGLGAGGGGGLRMCHQLLTA